MKYRSEIDGLRAFAVIPVLLFHAGFEFFNGGFIGVDIFFVISGYLITSIILKDMSNQSFSLVNFYERRARRILPALFFVLFCSIPFALIWMMPNQLIDFSNSLLSVVTFVSNIFFYFESGYFEASAELKPLLHTWSLSIEEQFYIFFPIFVILLWSKRLGLITIILFIVVILSLMLSQIGGNLKFTSPFIEKNFQFTSIPNFAFFLLPTRIWELGIGSLAALTLFKNNQDTIITPKNNFLSLFGLLIICSSIVLFDQRTPHPGLLTLFPILGTLLIIFFCESKTITAKILSKPIFVMIGLTSYSIYLWHVPILAYLRLRIDDELTFLYKLIAIALSILIGWISWKYIETPFRVNGQMSRKKIFIFSFSGILFFSAVAITLKSMDPVYISKKNEKILKYISFIEDNNPKLDECRNKSVSNSCSYGVKEKDSNDFYLWGDSHIDQLVPVFENIALNNNLKFKEYSFVGCPPLLDVQRKDILLKCKNNDEALNSIIFDEKAKFVVLHSYWQYYFDENNIQNIQNSQKIDYFIKLNLVINRIIDSGKSIILIGPIPRMEKDPPLMLARMYKFENIENPSISVSENKHYESVKESINIIHNLLKINPNIHYLDPANLLCENNKCYSNEGEEVFYRDDNHLSVTGSQKLLPELSIMISEILNKNKIRY
tara:strand:+ start:3861 stop:5849 length:1989 start_codon:yes stop_codon:yes gene_type:complete